MNSVLTDESADRFSLTLVFALLAHAAVILGVGFSVQLTAPPENPLPTLDVILVQQSTREAPEEADFLAQANQLGGGSKEKKVRPTAPLTGPALKPEPGIASVPSRAAAPKPQTETSTQILTRENASREVASEPKPEKQPDREVPTAAELMWQASQVARLQAELRESFQAYAHRARHKYISASTQEYLYASYMQSWVDKVERIGNLNFPPEAKRRGIHGSLILDVGIGWSGEVKSIRVMRSSGYEVLDQAAIHIVKLAAPYTPLPDPIREETDILHIVRTWQFLPGQQFESG